MLITFDPPLGDTIHVARPALFPPSQPMVLLFTARMSAHDYRNLVQDKARVELWSDLPRDTETGWGNLEFSDNTAMDDSSQNNQVKTLHLSVSIPATTSATCRFSFTYRVTYASGHITWLGAFGQNGLIIFNQGEDNLLYGLVLRQGWLEDDTQESRVFEIPEGISSMEVANMKNPSKFRIWALSQDGFIPHSCNASIFFLIPNRQRDSFTLNPTYVMSASPNSSITISPEGRITASGPGTILLQVNNIALEVGPFIRQVISRSKLDRWSLSFNSRSKCIAFAAPGAQDPRQAVVIPLWSSPNTQLPLNLANSFVDKSKRDAIAMAIFPSSRSGIHILDREIDGEVCLELGVLDATSPDFQFFVSPVYRLRHSATKIYSNWAVAILTPHKRASTHLLSNPSGILPTPPPSPHLRPIPSFSQWPASGIDNMLPSVSLVAPPDSSNNDETSVQISPEPVVPLVVTKSPPSENIVSIFASIFASLKSFFRLFFKVFLGPILPHGFDVGQANFQVQSEEEAPLGDLDDSADGPEHPIGEEINVIHEDDVPGSHTVPGVSGTEESMPLEHEDVESSPVSSEATVDVTASRTQSSQDLCTSEEMLCVELQTNEGQEEESTAVTVEIVFMPMPSRLASNRDVDPVPQSNLSNPKEGLERAVRFLDGSAAPSTLREVDVFFHDSSASNGASATRKTSCYMLQYQLGVVSLKKGKLITIVPPVESGA